MYSHKGSKVLRAVNLQSISVTENLTVAEADQAVAGIPRILEVTEVERPVTDRVAMHARYPVATVSVFPEIFLFIKGNCPFADWEFFFIYITQQRNALSTHENCVLFL